LFLGFLAVCFALGYPALARYDPSEEGNGNTDSFWYHRMISGGDGVVAPFGYRVLTPILARGVLAVVSHSNLNSWDPVFLSLLIVNAVFASLTAMVVMRIAATVDQDVAVAALSPLVYLSSFVVVNHHLAGLIDAAEAFFLAAVLLTLLRDRWLPAVVLIGLGALAKETVVPLGVCALTVWWAVARLRGSCCLRFPPAAILLSLAAGLVLLGVCRQLIDVPEYEGHGFSPSRLWSMFSDLPDCIFERTQVYAFAFLLPMGIPRLKRIPAPLLAASAAMAILAALLGAYANIAGNLHRPLFCAVGPVLAVSSAIFIRDLAGRLVTSNVNP